MVIFENRVGEKKEYFTPNEIAKLWGRNPKFVATLCTRGRIKGARRIYDNWYIPSDAQSPPDARYGGFKRERVNEQGDRVRDKRYGKFKRQRVNKVKLEG